MKSTIFICLFCLLYSGCTFISNKKEAEKPFFVTPKQNISTVLDSFVRVNYCKENCFNEIYVDKQDPIYYIMLIYTGKQSLTFRDLQKPIMYTVISGVKFDIYSGVEHFFEIDCDSIFREKQVTTYSDKGLSTWVVIDSLGIITVKDYFHAEPFMPLPGNTEKYFTGAN